MAGVSANPQQRPAITHQVPQASASTGSTRRTHSRADFTLKVSTHEHSFKRSSLSTADFSRSGDQHSQRLTSFAPQPDRTGGRWWTRVESPDPATVVFHLKFATASFLPSLADPFAFIYPKAVLDKDMRWFEQHVLGSGPFRFVGLRHRPVDQGRTQSGLLP